MAQSGDTITYTSTGSVIQEEISNVDVATVNYLDGAGGTQGGADGPEGGDGGRVENAVIDLRGETTLYLWVASQPYGRYEGGQSGPGGGGSTEVSFSNTDAGNSSNEPFLVGAGGGSCGAFGTTGNVESYGGARGGSTKTDTSFVGSEGDPPPSGGDGPKYENQPGKDGDGAIDDQDRGLVFGGTTIKGGGSAGGQDNTIPAENGEIQISYGSGNLPPDPPSNLSAEVQ